MTNSTMNADLIWLMLKEDPEFASSLSKEQMDVIEPFARKIPDILGDSVETKFDLQSVCEAKVMFLRYCTDHGFIEKFAEVTPTLKPFGKLGISIFKSALEKALRGFEEIKKNPNEILSARGVSEEEAIRGMGLSEENFQKYKEGSLTLGDVLVSQPRVFTTNT